MRRFALVCVVVILTLSASGFPSLIVTEPCTDNEISTTKDSDCSPTCVTCGCCAQAVEPVGIVVAAMPEAVLSDTDAALPGLPDTDPRAILHVPKLRFA